MSIFGILGEVPWVGVQRVGVWGMDELVTYLESLFFNREESDSYPLSIEKLQIHWENNILGLSY